MKSSTIKTVAVVAVGAVALGYVLKQAGLCPCDLIAKLKGGSKPSA